MGVWGTGLYSDDTACDVRDDYKDILGEGISEPDATKCLIEQWKSELSDVDTTLVFWLTLADVQWSLGRLQENVKKEALRIIEYDLDLPRWTPDKKLIAKRKVVLERLSKKLNSVQPTEKKIKKRFVECTDWNLGDVYSFRLKSGNLVLLHVIGFHQDKGGRGPVCEILDWVGEKIPESNVMEKMNYLYAKKPVEHLCQFLIGSLNKGDYKKNRINLVAQSLSPKQELGGYTAITWRFVDKFFEELIGLN